MPATSSGRRSCLIGKVRSHVAAGDAEGMPNPAPKAEGAARLWRGRRPAGAPGEGLCLAPDPKLFTDVTPGAAWKDGARATPTRSLRAAALWAHADGAIYCTPPRHRHGHAPTSLGAGHALSRPPSSAPAGAAARSVTTAHCSTSTHRSPPPRAPRAEAASAPGSAASSSNGSSASSSNGSSASSSNGSSASSSNGSSASSSNGSSVASTRAGREHATRTCPRAPAPPRPRARSWSAAPCAAHPGGRGCGWMRLEPFGWGGEWGVRLEPFRRGQHLDHGSERKHHRNLARQKDTARA